MGFMSAVNGMNAGAFKTLGALSTAGALVGGFAKGMNEQMIAAQEAADAEKKQRSQEAIAEFKASQKNAQKNAMALEYFNQVFGPGTQATKSAMQLFQMGVKPEDIIAGMQNKIPNGGGSAGSTGSGGSVGGGDKDMTGAPRMSQQQVYELALNAGYDPPGAKIASAVVMAESGGRPGLVAINDGGKGYNSYGLGQINGSHPGAEKALDAQESLNQMYKISNGGRNWNPWTTYTTSDPSRSYKQYMSFNPAAPGSSTSSSGSTASAPPPTNQPRSTDQFSVNPTQPVGFAEGGPIGFADGGDATDNDANQMAYNMSQGPTGQQQAPPMPPPAQQTNAPPMPQQGPNQMGQPRTMSDACPPAPPQAGQQYAQYTPGTILPVNPNAQFRQHTEQNQDEHLQLSRDANRIANRKLELEAEKAARELGPGQTQFAKSVFDESGKGAFNFEARQNAASSVRDADSALQMLSNGTLQTSRLQPVWDGANRLMSSLGFPVLENAGVANSVSAMNYLEKVASRQQFGEISKYHLGRWTEREVGLLARQVVGGQNDFNTNAKILLLLRFAAAEHGDYINAVREAGGHGETRADINRAMDAAKNFKPSDKAAWAQIDGNDPNQFAKVMASIQPNTWVENKASNKMYYYQGIQDGKYIFTGDGTAKPNQVDPQNKPWLYAIPVPQAQAPQK